MRRRVHIALAMIVLMVLPSCKAISSFIHDGDVVAKIGDHRLYRSEVESVIPKGTSPEDSAELAQKYINSWAKDKSFLEKAEQTLSKQEKDVKDELEAYKESLLSYRFEQLYIKEHLDTLVTQDQINGFYDSNKDGFKLERPILKARFLKVDKNSPNCKIIRSLMSSDQPADLKSADSLAFTSAVRYRDYSSGWIDAVTLAAEFGIDYVKMLSHKNGQSIEINNPDGTISYAYVADMKMSGDAAPIDFVQDRIKDIILTQRKHDLLSTLEQDLIEEARSNGNFVIYSE